MSKVKNILFIMCDQLRADHLSCYGHKHLTTPHLDALAARGTRFTRAYVQAPVCGPSRMSYYTGRYTLSHGATWNFVPLPVGERTLGDYLRPAGLRVAVVGKTHHEPDVEGMKWLGLSPTEGIGKLIGAGGFEDYGRDDGIHPDHRVPPDLPYNAYLRANGFGGANPWHEWANAGVDESGAIASGWLLRNAHRPTRLPEQFSETAYTTERAMAFITEQGDRPWCLHLSYIKPHWPYIVPDPYASMYHPGDALPVVRSTRETADPHPVFAAMMDHRVSRTFSRDEVRDAVLPGYMGLIKQIDDQMGVLFGFLEQRGLMDETMIVFTADHGDYLGDHWMGEKDLFHEPVIRAPLIIYDPDRRADRTRGTRCDAMVEAIDIAPTLLDVYGGVAAPHVLDGRSIRPLLFGERPVDWRTHVVCEYDYSFQDSRIALGTKPREAWMRMIFDGRWKYVLIEGYRPMLFDLERDPHEFNDLGGQPGYDAERTRLHELLFRWARQPRQRVTVSDAAIEAIEVQPRIAEGGILIGYWDEADLAQAREQFKPRFSATNPLVESALDRLTDPKGMHHD